MTGAIFTIALVTRKRLSAHTHIHADALSYRNTHGERTHTRAGIIGGR